jgi:hypothetical protein
LPAREGREEAGPARGNKILYGAQKSAFLVSKTSTYTHTKYACI